MQIIDKGLGSRNYKELLQFNNKKRNKPTEKSLRKHLVDISLKENIQLANKCMKRCSTLLIREMQVKATMRSYLTFPIICQKINANKNQQGGGEIGAAVENSLPSSQKLQSYCIVLGICPG